MHHSARRFRRPATGIAVAAIALALGACSKEAPKGQVVATVNGEDVTQSELNLEMNLAQAPMTDTKAKVAALQAVINRKLFAQAARDQKLDREPQFILTQRRAEEVMLAQAAAQAATRSSREKPSTRDIEDYLASHPWVGADRKLIQVEQIRFPMPRDPAQVRAMAPLKTMDALAGWLAQQGIQAERSPAAIDSATLPGPVAQKLGGTVNGEPLVILNAPMAVAIRKLGEAPLPAGAPPSQQIAANLITQERLTKAIKGREDALRKDAKITYADGMAPPANQAQAAAAQ